MNLTGTDIKYFRHLLDVSVKDVVFLVILYLFFEMNFMEYISSCVLLISVSVIAAIRLYFSLHHKYQNENQKSHIIRKLEDNDFHKLLNYPIYYMNESVEYGKIIENLFNTLTDKQKNLFISKGFSIVVGKYDKLKSMSLLPQNAQGVFDCNKKLIVLCQSTMSLDIVLSNGLSEETFTRVFYHEWGHFLDYINDFISESSFVRKSFKESKDKYVYYKDIQSDFSYMDRVKIFLQRLKWKFDNEYKNTEEYIADNYSYYRIGKRYKEDLKPIFDRFEGII